MTHRIKTIVVGLATVVSIVTVTGLAVWLSSSYLDQKYANAHQGCFPGQPGHKVVIQHNKALPANTVGTRCDTLTITNLDDIQRLVAFGPHESHVPYDGVAEQTLAKGQSLTVTLVQTGNFRFHDHIHDEVQGTFTVRDN